MSCSSDPKAIKSYRKAVVGLLDTNFSKLNSVLEGCLEAFNRKAYEAKLISDQVMKDKSFNGMINEFKAGMEWCRNTLEIQNRCTDFIEILESLGGPAKTAGQDLNAKLLILDEKHEVLSVESHTSEGTEKVVNLLHMRIEQVPELAVVAAGLKKKFRQLFIVVKKSLTSVDISDVKSIIKLAIVDNSCRVSDTIRLYLYKLRKFEKVEEILDFLIEYRFIGYLNYGLLKEISILTNDENVSKDFKKYETEYHCKLLKSSKFNLLMQVFCEYPDLSPTTAIGLPEIMFQLEDSWEDESMETWQRYVEINFPWSGSLAVKELSPKCIFITYACHPAKYNEILKDLCNPDVLERLKSDEISVHILESEATVALQQIVTYDFELDDIQMDRTAESVVSAPSLESWIPNKAIVHVDKAHTRVNSILTNKNILSSTPENKQLLEIKTELEEAQKEIRCLDTNYQKMVQDIEQERVAYYRTISKLVVQDVVTSAKTKISFQEVQETQSRYDVALQQHQNELAAYKKRMNKLEADMKYKADSEHLISVEEDLETLKVAQAQQNERIDTTDERIEDLISSMQMDERNARRQSRTGSQLEEFIEVYREPSREELKQSLKEAHRYISLTQLYEPLVLNYPRLDSGVSITSTESLQRQLTDEGPTSSFPITSPDSGFKSSTQSRETSSSQAKLCDNFAPVNTISEAIPETNSFQLKTYQVPTIQITEATTDS